MTSIFALFFHGEVFPLAHLSPRSASLTRVVSVVVPCDSALQVVPQHPGAAGGVVAVKCGPAAGRDCGASL